MDQLSVLVEEGMLAKESVVVRLQSQLLPSTVILCLRAILHQLSLSSGDAGMGFRLHLLDLPKGRPHRAPRRATSWLKALLRRLDARMGIFAGSSLW